MKRDQGVKNQVGGSQGVRNQVGDGQSEQSGEIRWVTVRE